MHLLFVDPSPIAHLDGRALALARSSGDRVTICTRRPAGLVGTLTDEVVVVDARSDPAAARTFCRELSALSAVAPALVVLDADQLAGYGADWGAADVVVPTASATEFRARVRRLAELYAGRNRRHVHHDDLRLDLYRQSLDDGRTTVALSATETAALAVFLGSGGAVLTRAELSALCSDGHPAGVRHVDVVVCRLRRKLGRHGRRIETVRSVGYRFAAAEAADGLASSAA